MSYRPKNPPYLSRALSTARMPPTTRRPRKRSGKRCCMRPRSGAGWEMSYLPRNRREATPDQRNSRTKIEPCSGSSWRSQSFLCRRPNPGPAGLLCWCGARRHHQAPADLQAIVDRSRRSAAEEPEVPLRTLRQPAYRPCDDGQAGKAAVAFGWIGGKTAAESARSSTAAVLPGVCSVACRRP